MNRRRTDHQLAHHADRLPQTRAAVTNALDHIERQRRYAITVSAGTERTSTGDHSDPTANAAARIIKLGQHNDDILDAIKAFGQALDRIDQACRHAFGVNPRVAADEPRCTGGDPSPCPTCGKAWGAIDCGRLCDHYLRADGTTGYYSDMLCPAHRMAKWRHERKHRDDF